MVMTAPLLKAFAEVTVTCCPSKLSANMVITEGPTVILTLPVVEPPVPVQVNTYVVVLVSLGVVYVPDTPVSPLGEEEHEVLRFEDQVMVVLEL
jgi:hypothetical protein